MASIINSEVWKTISLAPYERVLHIPALVKILQQDPAKGLLVRTLVVDYPPPLIKDTQFVRLDIKPSMPWIEATYSREFATWFHDNFIRSQPSVGRAVALLIAHMPGLDHLVCNFYDPQDQKLLFALFERCQAARLQRLTGPTPLSLAVGKTPMMQLTKASVYNKHIQWALNKFGSILEVLNMPYVAGAFENALAALPNLQQLSWFSWAGPKADGTTPAVDLGAVGAALRHHGLNLTHLKLYIMRESGEGALGDPNITGAVGSLRDLTNLRELSITASNLFGIKKKITLTAALPPSLELLYLMAHDADEAYPFGVDIGEREISKFLARSQNFPRLGGIMLDWESGANANINGWERVEEDEDDLTLFARSGAADYVAARLNVEYLAFSQEPAYDWGVPSDDEQQFQALGLTD